MTVLEEKVYSQLRHCGFLRRVKGYDCQCIVIPAPIIDHLLKRIVFAIKDPAGRWEDKDDTNKKELNGE